MGPISWLAWPSPSTSDTIVVVAVGLVAFTLVPGSLGSRTGRLLKWPTMLVAYSAITVELTLYGIIRVLIMLVEATHADLRTSRLHRAMDQSGTYSEWHGHARELDELQGRVEWQSNLNDYTAEYFSWSLLDALMADLRTARDDGDVAMALAVLQQCIRKNVGGTESEELFSVTNTGEPKVIVQMFVAEVVCSLRWVTDQAKNERAGGGKDCQFFERVKDFLVGVRLTYGRMALCLSGGGMMAMYHLGHIRTLYAEGILPRVICGSSAGSLVAALACTRTDEELQRDLKGEVVHPYFTCCARSWPQRLLSLWRTGAIFDNEEWLKLADWFTCGLTFAEAHKKTGRTLCITLSTTTIKSPPIVLNHMSAPNVLISSAVVASSAVPGILRPMYLLERCSDGSVKALSEEYWDGSIEQDIPKLGLAEMLNCQFVVAAQCNPHLLPFVFNADGTVGRPTRWKNSRRGGHLLSGLELYLKMDFKFKLQFLRDVGAVTGFASSLMIQDFSGTTNIVPRISILDYFKIVEDPTMDDLSHYFQRGSVAAYKNCAHIKLRLQVERTLSECLLRLDKDSMIFDWNKSLLEQILVTDEEKDDEDHFVLALKRPRRYSVISSTLTGRVSLL